MNKKYHLRKVEKILHELDAYKHSLAYLTALQETAALLPRAAETTRKRISSLTLTITSLEHALQLLTPLEHTIITNLYLNPEHSFDDLCSACALEKSSVYRYRTRALRKLAAAMFGEE